MKGWRYEGYRHSLAARGIKTGRMSFVATYSIPRWLLDKLDEAQRERAEVMLFDEGMRVSDVAQEFGLKHPGSGVYRSPQTFLTRDEKIEFIKNKADELGRIPRSTDITKDVDGITAMGLSLEFGSWNDLLRAADLDTLRKDIDLFPISDKLEKFGGVPEADEMKRDYSNEVWYPEVREGLLEKRRERWANDPEFRERELERAKEYHQTPEWKEKHRESEKERRANMTPEEKKEYNVRRYYKDEIEEQRLAEEAGLA